MKTHNNSSSTDSHRAIMAVMVPLMLVLFISTLDQTIVATALAGIGNALGQAQNATWIATAYLLTSAITTLIFGKLGDIYGRKRIFQIAVAVFVVGSGLCALAPSMTWLIIFRAFQGIGGGGLSTLVMTIVGDLVPARNRAKYQATLGIVPMMAIILGPVAGGLIVDTLGWPWIFLINVPIGIAAFLMIAAKLHLPRHHSGAKVDYAGGLLAMLFTTALLLTTIYGGQTYAWLSPQIIGLLALGVLSLLLYIWVESRAAEPMTPLHLFADSIFSISSALFFLSTAVLFVAMLFTPLMLQTVYSLSAFAAGTYLIPLLLGLIGATIVAGSIITKTGRYHIFPVLGALLCMVGFGLMSVLTMTSPTWEIAAILVIMGVGIGLFIQVALLAGQNAVPSRFLGVATGTLNFFKTLGGAAGAALFGAIYLAALPAQGNATRTQAMVAFHTVYHWAVPLMVVAFMLALFLKEKPLSEEMVEVAEGKTIVPEY